MIILIAESKTMRSDEMNISENTYLTHRPTGEDGADEVMRRVAETPAAEITNVCKVSPTMAAKIIRMAYEFPDKRIGLSAVEAFTGVVFRAFSFQTLDDSAKAFTAQKVRIISSLYGWLHPDDIIKPYRFDFSTPLAPDHKTFSTFRRKDVTIQLVHEIQSSGESAILNLLPADASKCIDWKLVRKFAKVWKVDFKELKEGGTTATPNANRLKTLRGSLLRHIVTRRISDPAELLTLVTDDLLPLGLPDYPDHIAFCV